jgi:hypothetical protein
MFYRRKTDFYEKKICRSAVCLDFMVVQMKNFVRPLFERWFQVRDFPFESLKELELVLTGFLISKTNSVG